MSAGPYFDPGITGSDGRLYVQGPGNGFGYDAGTLWPQRRLSTEADVRAAVELCNEAYRQGYAKALANVRAAIGVPT